MSRSRLATLAAATFALGLAGGDAAAKEKAGPHLRYAKTYAEAVAEAKDRHAVIFATFHKDN